MNRRHHEPDAPLAPVVVVSRVRSILVHASLVLFAVAILVRAGQLQLVEGRHWAAQALKQQVVQNAITPPRGRILDANGMVLVETREMIRLAVVPRDVRTTVKHGDARAIIRTHLTRLGVPPAEIRRALDPSLSWVPISDYFLPSDVQPLLALPGIRATRHLRRIIAAQSEGLRRVIGAVDLEDVARGGIEQEMDSVLSGTRGLRSMVRDPRGGAMETPLLTGVEARPGHTVTLTINSALQDIAERALRQGMQDTRASGGDIVIVDARDGAILALAGSRNGRPAASPTALTEAYEPGSIIKPFMLARLLDDGLTREEEMINTENGRFVFAGRGYDDQHKAAAMSVRDVIRFSSNVGAIKLAQRLAAAGQYQALRDYGFGVPTGVSYPSESRGMLPVPRRWSNSTSAALAIGYEVAATPLQLAMAYGVIASGGELLQPSLVGEIRTADGEVVYRHSRRVVRRVLSPDAAVRMRTILAAVVDSGTGTAARLATFDVAGKSGTARIAENGRYVPRYNASFAGMFPAQAPQFVFVARLINPQGAYFGGVVAAPMVNTILRNAIAARDGSLDRRALAAVARPIAPERDSAARRGAPDVSVAMSLPAGNRAGAIGATPAVLPVAAIIEPASAPARIVVTLPVVGDTTASSARSARLADDDADLRMVPLVAGLTVRQAVRTLNAAGFEVRLAKGQSGRTSPAAGRMARAGSVVVLELAP